MSNPSHATVRSTLPTKMSPANCLSTLDAVCATAAQCAEVQASTIAKPAFTALQAAVTTAHTSVGTKASLALALVAAAKTLDVDLTGMRVAARTFEAVVAELAGGDAALIAKTGLTARAVSPPPAALAAVGVVTSKPGKHPGEAIVSWPRAAGAKAYGIEANFAPQSPTGAYVALASGTSRRRTLKGPAPGAQFLVRVTSLASDGTPADPSDPILATAR